MNCCNNRHIIAYPPCAADCPEAAEVNAENVNLAGSGVLESQNGQNLYFKGISAGDYATVTYDNITKTIVIDVDPTLINGDFPDATTTVKGKVELATDAEVQGLTDANVVVTPLGLAALTPSTTRVGLLELATVAEAEAGLDSSRAVTPQGLAAAIDAVSQTTTFANAAARTAATPTHQGQIGLQLDTGAIYRATGLAAGNWSPVNLDGPTISNTINFVGTTWQLDSVAIPADSVLITGGTDGQPSSVLLSTFLRTSGTQTVGNTTLNLSGADTIQFFHGATNVLGIGSSGIGTDGTLYAAGDVTFEGNVDFTSLPTSNPAIAGRLWNDAGTVKISAG